MTHLDLHDFYQFLKDLVFVGLGFGGGSILYYNLNRKRKKAEITKDEAEAGKMNVEAAMSIIGEYKKMAALFEQKSREFEKESKSCHDQYTTLEAKYSAIKAQSDIQIETIKRLNRIISDMKEKLDNIASFIREIARDGDIKKLKDLAKNI